VVVQATEANDYSFLTRLRSNLVPIPIGFSDWVDPQLFHPLSGVEKQYDAVYVTNYNPLKRHHVLLDALRQLDDPTFKVAMVCGDNGNARSEILQLIHHFDVDKNVTFYDCIPQKDLNIVLNASKVNMLLSLKEGSNRSIFEGFFANVPGIVLKRNRGVRKDYINEMTGRLINDEDLPETLLHFRTQWSHYRPREWALANISPAVTTEKLSALLKDIAGSNHEAWSEGLVAKVNSPELAYLDPEDARRMPASGALLSLFSQTSGKRIADRDMLESSLKRICNG
jgi:glycosyltransferase involved in cell wall biosynthesis